MYYVELLTTTRNAVVCACWLIVALAINLIVWNIAHLTADPHYRLPIDIVWAVAGFVASIVASILGKSLASENDGHLPVAWTKPVSRTAHALGKFAVDLTAVVFVFAFACGIVFVYLAATGLIHDLIVPSDTWQQLFRFFLAPFAFYGLMQALTSTLARQSGTVVGLTWTALFTLIVLSIVKLPTPFHAIVDFINYANPLVYIAFSVNDNGTVVTYGLGAAPFALALIAAIGGAIAVYRWQRLEA